MFLTCRVYVLEGDESYGLALHDQPRLAERDDVGGERGCGYGTRACAGLLDVVDGHGCWSQICAGLLSKELERRSSKQYERSHTYNEEACYESHSLEE
jgi:hypothetical protein